MPAWREGAQATAETRSPRDSTLVNTLIRGRVYKLGGGGHEAVVATDEPGEAAAEGSARVWPGSGVDGKSNTVHPWVYLRRRMCLERARFTTINRKGYPFLHLPPSSKPSPSSWKTQEPVAARSCPPPASKHTTAISAVLVSSCHAAWFCQSTVRRLHGARVWVTRDACAACPAAAI